MTKELPTVTVGPQLAEETSGNNLLDRTDEAIRTMIRDAVEHSGALASLPHPLAKMGIKIAAPEYKGEKSQKEFEDYLSALLRWFDSYGVMGEDQEPGCTALVGHTLKGDALEWYNETVGRNARTLS